MVLLVPSEPTPAFKDLIVLYSKTQRVQYLRGDLLSTDDLARVRLDDAVGCFILADKHAPDPNAAGRPRSVATLPSMLWRWRSSLTMLRSTTAACRFVLE